MKSTGLVVAALVLALAGCSRNGDEELTKNVREVLENERTPAAQYEVSTKERIVTITGVVENEADRDRLIDGARSVKGVLGVDNRLTISAPVQVTGAADVAFNPEDRALKDAIRQRLDLAGIRGVRIDVRDGVVTMQGELPRDRYQEALHAVQAQGAAVKRVDDLMVPR